MPPRDLLHCLVDTDPHWSLIDWSVHHQEAWQSACSFVLCHLIIGEDVICIFQIMHCLRGAAQLCWLSSAAAPVGFYHLKYSFPQSNSQQY